MTLQYEDLIEEINPFGRYQKTILLLISLPVVPIAMQAVITVYTLGTPKHRCAVPNMANDAYNLPDHTLLNGTVPTDVGDCYIYDNTTGVNGSKTLKECKRMDDYAHANGDPVQTSYFDYLPDDIVLSIFQFITDFDDMFTLRRLSKRLSIIAKDRTLAPIIDCRKRIWMSKGTLYDFITPYAKCIQILNLDNCYWLQPTEAEMFLQCTQLRSLHIMQMEVPASILCQILANQTKLTSLSISISDIDDFHVQLAASPGAQECFRRIVQLKLHFSNKLYHGFKPVVNFSMLPTLFEYCRDVQEIHIYGNKKGSRAVTQSIIQPHNINVNNLKNLTVLTLNTNVDPVARLIFYETLNSVCNLPVQFKTLLPFSNYDDQWWTQDAHRNAMANAENLVHLDISGMNMSLYNIERAGPKLTYLNISGNQNLVMSEMNNIGRYCRNLTCLNLENCIHILLRNAPHHWGLRRDEPRVYNASGLENVISSCVKLSQLNLKGIHIHPEYMAATSHKNLPSLLCKNTKWQSLSIPTCCLPTEHTCSKPEEKNPDLPVKAICRKCLLVNINPSDPMSLLKRPESEPETDFQKLVRLSPDMEHFELIGPGFTSAFSKTYGVQPTTSSYGQCEVSLNIDDFYLLDIYYWKKLKSLQLTAIEGIKLGYSLWTIAKGCLSLEQLYISCLGQLSHCTYIDWLVKSLPLFYKLKDFRLEHPQLAVNKKLLRAIGKCSSLERICIVSMRGTFSTEEVKRLFARLPNLFSFQLYTDEPVRKCVQLKNFLLEEYQESRPALSVCIYPLLNSDLQEVVAQQVPDQHFDEMTILTSRVAMHPEI
ncbi:hypothetical protein Btru_073648 [Bulinus truncatus]|nr:hypothetical protein Btru_073648 [Bulinus truncatus]